MTNLPVSVELASRKKLVAPCLAWTAAPGMAAPDGSVTVPTIDPRSLCAIRAVTRLNADRIVPRRKNGLVDNVCVISALLLRRIDPMVRTPEIRCGFHECLPRPPRIACAQPRSNLRVLLGGSDEFVGCRRLPLQEHEGEQPKRDSLERQTQVLVAGQVPDDAVKRQIALVEGG